MIVLASSAEICTYDAAYFGLADKLGATLITRDRRLASGSAGAISIEVL